MSKDKKKQEMLKNLPGVDTILELSQEESTFQDVPKSVITGAIRQTIEVLRGCILSGENGFSEEELETEKIMECVKQRVDANMALNLTHIINGTGVVVHTNLGRSLLPEEAADHIAGISGRYSNLEFDVSSGTRGIRYALVEELLCDISGAEAAMAVNNNAGAVLLCLETLARDREVIVSRGELVEIGGSFRIPDVMSKSGAVLMEVGTTNRTHSRDYESAIKNETALLLKVHKSNYRVVGFTSEVSLKELVEIGGKYHIPVMEDLGSGTFIDFSAYGMTREPTVQDSVKAGVDVVTFSGDKLLGGPQAGIIVGKKKILDRIKKNPLTRALRIDKLTLAALESTLRLYRDEEKAVKAIPTLRMLTAPLKEIEKRAEKLYKSLETLDDSRLNVRLMDLSSRTGGGALPMMELLTKCVGMTIEGMSVNSIEGMMRKNKPPVIGRIEDDIFIIDLRTVLDDELYAINKAVADMLKRGG